MARILLYLLDLAVFLFVVWILNRALQRLFGTARIGFRSSSRARQPNPAAPPERGETARDPVCGMFVSTELSQRLTQGDQTLHFCSRACLERYQEKRSHA